MQKSLSGAVLDMNHERPNHMEDESLNACLVIHLLNDLLGQLQVS